MLHSASDRNVSTTVFELEALVSGDRMERFVYTNSAYLYRFFGCYSVIIVEFDSLLCTIQLTTQMGVV